MKKGTVRIIRITALILLIQTVIWVVFMGISSAPIEPGWGDVDYLLWASERGTAYLINYVNVTLLTIVVVVFFAFLYVYLKDGAEKLALSGLLLVPVYGVLNLVVYSLQISLVPTLATNALSNGESITMAAQLIQVNPSSVAGYFNGLAYAILGIPSIGFGILLYRSLKKLSGLFLALNGALCILGIIGYFTGNGLLSMGILLGGIAFLVFLLMMVIEFRAIS